jgi:hypothetical protein
MPEGQALAGAYLILTGTWASRFGGVPQAPRHAASSKNRWPHGAFGCSFGRMSDRLATLLQDSLGESFVLERELGGGGMARESSLRASAAPGLP